MQYIGLGEVEKHFYWVFSHYFLVSATYPKFRENQFKGKMERSIENFGYLAHKVAKNI